MSVKVAKTLNEFYCFKCKPEAAYNSPMVHLEDYTVIDKSPFFLIDSLNLPIFKNRHHLMPLEVVEEGLN